MKLKSNIGVIWWILSLILVYAAEVFDKLSRAAGEGRIGALIRVFLILGTCFYIFISLGNKIHQKSIFLFILVFTSICLGMLFTVVNQDYSLTASTYMLIRYYSGIIFLTSAAITVLKVRDEQLIFNLNALSYIFIFIFLFNLVCAIFGYLFDLDTFKTYGYFLNESSMDAYYDSRFGYNGLIVEQNISSYFFFIGFVLIYFFMNLKRLFLFFYFLCVVIVSLLTGTKSLFIMSLMFFIYIVIKNNFIKYTMLFSLFLFIFSYLIFKNKIGILSDFNFWNSILSNRLSYVYERFFIEKINLNVSNILFGNFYDDAKKFLVELEFIDLFNFLGVFGASTFLYIVYFTIKSAFDGLENRNGRAAIFIIIFASIFSGHLFYDPTSSFFFSYLILFIGLLGRKNELSKRF